MSGERWEKVGEVGRSWEKVVKSGRNWKKDLRMSGERWEKDLRIYGDRLEKEEEGFENVGIKGGEGGRRWEKVREGERR